MTHPELEPDVTGMTEVDVVLVDDDDGVRFLVEKRARREGISIVCCHDGSSARDVLASVTTRLLILDQRLPDCTGDSLLEELLSASLVGDARVAICTSELPIEEICARIRDMGAEVRHKADVLERGGVAALLSQPRESAAT